MHRAIHARGKPTTSFGSRVAGALALAASSGLVYAVEDPSTLVTGSPGEAYVARYIGELFEADISQGDPLDEVDLNDRVADVAVTMRSDPSTAIAERKRRELDQRVAQEALARQIRLDALGEENELRMARIDATRKIRDFTKTAEADGVWTDEEIAEFDILHNQWSEIWQFTPEEQIALDASNDARQDVFDEIRQLSKNLGLMSAEEIAERKDSRDFAKDLIELQEIEDVPWLGDIHITMTGEMADQLVDDIFNQRETQLQAWNTMIAADIYLQKPGISFEEAKFARQIRTAAYIKSEAAIDAMAYDGAVILLGTAADGILTLAGGPATKIAGKVGTAVRGTQLYQAGAVWIDNMWTTLWRNSADEVAQTAGAQGDNLTNLTPAQQARIQHLKEVAEVEAENFIPQAEAGANAARKLGLPENLIDDLVTEATGSDHVADIGISMGYRGALAARAELRAIRQLEENFIAPASQAGVRDEIIEEIMQAAIAEGTTTGFLQVAQRRLLISRITHEGGTIVVEGFEKGWNQAANAFTTQRTDYFTGLFDEAFDGFLTTSDIEVMSWDVVKNLHRQFQQTGSLPQNLNPFEMFHLEQIADLSKNGTDSLWFFDGLESGFTKLDDGGFFGAIEDWAGSRGARQSASAAPVDELAGTVYYPPPSHMPSGGDFLTTIDVPGPASGVVDRSADTVVDSFDGFRSAETQLDFSGNYRDAETFIDKFDDGFRNAETQVDGSFAGDNAETIVDGGFAGDEAGTVIDGAFLGDDAGTIIDGGLAPAGDRFGYGFVDSASDDLATVLEGPAGPARLPMQPGNEMVPGYGTPFDPTIGPDGFVVGRGIDISFGGSSPGASGCTYQGNSGGPVNGRTILVGVPHVSPDDEVPFQDNISDCYSTGELDFYAITGYCESGSTCTELEVTKFNAGIQDAFGGAVITENVRGRTKAAPSDPYFSSTGSWGESYDDQWAIKSAGFTAESYASLQSQGAANPVIVAIIDSGLDWHHPDFSQENLWFNADEVAGNGVDDDSNGYVDDMFGWNFISSNNVPWDRDGHGTFVAGVIAARSDNKRGITGINPHARLMVLKAIDDAGNTNSWYVAKAITYATDNGAQVINLSVAGNSLSRIEQIAVDYALGKNVVVVGAAGNNGDDVSSYSPGGLEHVITVAAYGPDDSRVAFSNWGPAIDIAAPGVDVLSLRATGSDLSANVLGDAYTLGDAVVDGAYYRASGTSFAAPIVTGTVSLILAAHPGYTPHEVRRVLLNSARDNDDLPGVDQFTGHGFLDAAAALSADPEFFIDAAIADVAVVRDGDSAFLEVLGTADANQFMSASIWLGAGDDPADWKEVAEMLTQPVSGGILGRIGADDLRGAPQWTLRLVTRHLDGQTREARFKLNLN